MAAKRTKTTRDLERLQRLQNLFLELHHKTRRDCLPFDDYLARRKAIHENPEYLRLPKWARDRLTGYDDALWAVHKSYLKWQLYLDGSPVESRDVPAGQWSRVTGAHVYISDPTKFWDGAAPVSTDHKGALALPVDALV